MEFRQLEYFSRVAKLKNFTHAAEELHVSQPSITTAIHKLEEELGVVLLERTSKNVRLTPKGKIFYQRVNEILNSVRVAVAEVKSKDEGIIKFGLPPMIGAYLFPDIFCKLRTAIPEVEFQILEKGSIEIRSALDQGNLQVGIMILPEITDSLATMPLVKQQAHICMSPNHPLADKKVISFEELKTEKFVVLTEEFVHRKVFQAECQKYGISPDLVFSSDKIDTVKAMVATGLGITLLMDMIVKDDTRIVKVPLENPIIFNIGLAWKKNISLNADCTKIIDFISEQLTEKCPY